MPNNLKLSKALNSNMTNINYSPFKKFFTSFLLIVFFVSFSFTAHSQNTFLDFDGVNDYISIADNPSQQITGDITLETWFKVDATVGDWVRLVGKGDISNRQYGLWFHPNGHWLFQIYCGGGNLEYLAPVTVGEWYHFAAVKNGTNVKLYINGVEVADGTFGTSACATTEPLTIGYAGFHTFMNGQMDETRVWNVARTPAQIAASWNTDVASYKTGLIAYYSYNDGLCAGDNTGQLASNMATSTGSVNNGTLNNFALDGSVDGGCSSNFVCEHVSCATITEPPITARVAVPTLGQWGLIALALLLFIVATVAIRSRQIILADA